jgi:hopene-associated glycosyltransferase HpnB
MCPDLATRSPAPKVVAIMPARDEAEGIGKAIESLIQQDYPGLRQILVVDDHSSDETVEIVLRVSRNSQQRVSVISSTDLPEGWTGKMWALFQGVQQATELEPDYFLFSDADIVRSATSLTSLVTVAEFKGLDLLSMMPKLECSTFAERALLPAFLFYFFMLYPPEWVSSANHNTAAAAGGNVLVRARALARMGGIAKIRHELIDDCAMAREIKRIGKIQLGWTEDACSVRKYKGFREIGAMISRTAFYQLRHSIALLFASIVSLTIVFLAPPMLLFLGGWGSAMAFLAWALMSVSYIPTLNFFSLSFFWAPFLPLITLFYQGATLYSAIQYYRGQGGKWKNRSQDTRALRSPSGGKSQRITGGNPAQRER